MKYLFLTLISFLVIQVPAQTKNFNKAKKYFKKKSYDQAIEYINLAIENPETGEKSETHYYKGLIYINLTADKKTNTKYPNATEIAEQAFLKSYAIDSNEYNKYVLIYNNGSNQMFVVYSNYFKQGADAYNAQNFTSALESFKKCFASRESIKKVSSIELPKLDTSLILNIASASENISLTAKKEKNLEKAKMYDSISAHYYQMITDAKVSGDNYLNIYKWMAYYYYQMNKNSKKLDYFIELGRELYPFEPYFIRLSIDLERRKGKEEIDYPSLFSLYKQILILTEKDKEILGAYASDLFSYIHPSYGKDRPENFKELSIDLDKIYTSLMQVDTANIINYKLDMGKHKYNQIIYVLNNDYKNISEDIREEQKKLRKLINKYSGSKSSSYVAKRKKYEKEYDDLNKKKQTSKIDFLGDHLEKAINNLEYVFDYYDKKNEKLSRYEKSIYKSSIDLLINCYTEKNIRNKITFYEDKYDNANRK